GNAARLVGAGPFRLVHWFAKDAIVLERHNEYYGGASEIPPVGRACVERVVFNIVPYNESRVAGLLAGDFDIIVDVLPHSISVLERHANTKVFVVDSTRSFFIALNTQAPPFSDARVRHAVAYALDREQLINEQLSGNATLIDGILSPNAFGKNKRLHHYTHDPNQARALLAAAGYPNGLDVDLDVIRQFFPLAESIALQLARVGIRARTVAGESRDLRRKWMRARAKKVGHMWLTSWGNASLDPTGIFEPTHRTGGRGNSAGYSDPNMDALLDAAATELVPERRADLYREAEEMANQDLPYVYLWVPKDVYGLSTRVQGFRPAPDGRLNLQDVCIDSAQ
ncbi:MAG: ABC transporter substrate-binding protein, partial [Acidiferrobacterales bacterium]